MCVSGEVENPSETIPKSLIFGLPTIAVIYILTNVSYLAVLTPQEIIASGMSGYKQSQIQISLIV